MIRIDGRGGEYGGRVWRGSMEGRVGGGRKEGDITVSTDVTHTYTYKSTYVATRIYTDITHTYTYKRTYAVTRLYM